ncbi:hypothetical protein BDA99DRAFT_133768 [Phascolomyces articulosus]|uniref:Uncharacterized protein n=1 Tax=Phascolomyces articulosus TaxID=60185 RepID=A0AAD5K669_9FUNG|nr:hypothetical protein BDA99DRAFT_133768 [Phascolomyces articulosus]
MHGVHPFSLRPPPHLMRSRRQSRTTQQGITESRSMNNLQQQISSSSALSDGPETKSQASSKNSSTSAVSPRFMALRKLSEVALMAPYSKPPPPPPPPTTQSSSENSSIAPDTTDLNYNLNEQRLLERIDDLIESRLKSNISEILWRATESHRDARRFWEEQRRDMLELGSSILHKLSNTADQLKHQQYRERKEGEEEEEEQELENLRKLRIDLENEVSGYQLKQIAQQTEIQSMRHRNLELEKEVEAYRQRNSDLEAQVARLGVHHGSNVVQDRPCVTPVTVETRDVQTDNIGIIMDWADVVAEEEWANKYSELESRYDIANNKIAELEKKLSLQQRQQHSHHYQQRPTSRSATRSPLSQSRPASSMALVAPPLSLTTNNTPATSTRATSPPVSSKQRKHKSMTPTTPNNKERKASHRQSYFMNEEGHLTFTTEINGRLSQYTVKLPGKEGNSNHSNNNNYYNNSTKLNPLAQPWKTPATMST